MTLRNRTTGEIITPRQFRAAHPNVAFPAVISQADAERFDADVVTRAPRPDASEFETVETGPVEQIEGVWTQTWATAPIPLEDARAILRERVKAERQNREQAGVSFAFSDGIGLIQTRDDTDTRNIQGVVTTAMILQAQAVTDPVLEFRDADNVNHALTPTQAIEMGMAVSAHVNALYSAKWTHDAAIEQLADTAACAAYDTTTGWPE